MGSSRGSGLVLRASGFAALRFRVKVSKGLALGFGVFASTVGVWGLGFCLRALGLHAPNGTRSSIGRTSCQGSGVEGSREQCPT